MKKRLKNQTKNKKNLIKNIWKKQRRRENKLLNKKGNEYLKKNGSNAVLPKKLMNLLGSQIIFELKNELKTQEMTPGSQNEKIYSKYQNKFKSQKRKIQSIFRKQKDKSPAYQVLFRAKNLLLNKSKEKDQMLPLDIFLRHKRLSRKVISLRQSLNSPLNKENKHSQRRASRRSNPRLKMSLFGPPDTLRNIKKGYYLKKHFAPRKKTFFSKNYREKNFSTEPNNIPNINYLSQRKRSNFFITELSKSTRQFNL